MSNKRSHRRPGARNRKRTENGPRWENPNPGAGCNSTHVARARAWWKRRDSRDARRQVAAEIQQARKGEGETMTEEIPALEAPTNTPVFCETCDWTGTDTECFNENIGCVCPECKGAWSITQGVLGEGETA